MHTDNNLMTIVSVNKKPGLVSNQRGITLIEALIAMVILSIVSVTFLSAMTTSSRAVITTDRLDTSRTIAQAQMEWVKNLSFSSSGTYSHNSTLMSQYPGYTVAISACSAAERDSSIQLITISVTYNNKVLTTLQDCKAK
jgi:prepilin-type N-terminal cleavage/methylation domain-containing protein